jgi:hypothetical protein
VHDAGQTGQGRVGAQVKGVDEDLEGAPVVAVGELGAGASKDRACSISATVRTWSAGT